MVNNNKNAHPQKRDHPLYYLDTIISITTIPKPSDNVFTLIQTSINGTSDDFDIWELFMVITDPFWVTDQIEEKDSFWLHPSGK